MKRKDIGFLSQPEKLLLTRWKILDTRWFGVFVHCLRTEDKPIYHDHPWAFTSIVLRGGYWQQRRTQPNEHVRFINHISRDEAHYISKLDRTPTWTLVFVGKTHRVWGFWKSIGDSRWEWIPWTHVEITDR